MQQLRNHLFLVACLGGMSVGLHGMDDSTPVNSSENLVTPEVIKTYTQIQRIYTVLQDLLKQQNVALVPLEVASEIEKDDIWKIDAEPGFKPEEDESGIGIYNHHTDPYPYLHQTTQGFILQTFPMCGSLDLYTPWGMMFAIKGHPRSIDCSEWVTLLKEHICTQFNAEETTSSGRTTYRLMTLNSEPLPYPNIKDSKLRTTKSCEAITQTWRAVKMHMYIQNLSRQA